MHLFAGGMASGVQVAISMSNTGGAWDNAKKYIERATPDSELQGKGSDIHKVRQFTFCLSRLFSCRIPFRTCPTFSGTNYSEFV